MSTHNICFRREIRKILCGYPLLSVAMEGLCNPLHGIITEKYLASARGLSADWPFCFY